MMKMRYLWIPLLITMLVLVGCKDKEVPMETSSDETADQEQTTDLGNMDKEIKKYRDKAQKYVSTDISDVIEHQNNAMKAVKKARDMDVGKEQYEVFVNEAIPEAKQAVEEAKSLKSEAQTKDLQQLQDKFVTPLNTFVNLLERKADSLKAETQQKKNELEQEYEKYAKQYMDQLTTFYEHLQSVKDKYHLNLSWDDIETLKEQLKHQLEIANFLHMADDHLQDFISFHEDVIDKMQHLVDISDSDLNRDSIKKFKEDLFPELDHLLQDDWDEELNHQQTAESVDRLKEAIDDQLEAIQEHKQGTDKEDKKRLEEARKKYEQSKTELEQLHDHLGDFKSELEDNG